MRTGFRGMEQAAQGFAAYRRRKRWRGRLMFIGLWGAAALAGTAYGAGWLDGLWQRHSTALPTVAGVRAHFLTLLYRRRLQLRVDGDTIWLKRKKIRIADIDAPETHDPRCASEKDWATALPLGFSSYSTAARHAAIDRPGP